MVRIGRQMNEILAVQIDAIATERCKMHRNMNWFLHKCIYVPERNVVQKLSRGSCEDSTVRPYLCPLIDLTHRPYLVCLSFVWLRVQRDDEQVQLRRWRLGVGNMVIGTSF